MTTYKVLDKNLCSFHGGKAKWTVGRKKSVKGELVPCRNGIHVCRDERDLLSWLGPVICECEHSDEYVEARNKRVVRWARIGDPNPYWNERTARHFACDCAEYALPYAQDDQRELLQACIDVARAYADWPEEWDEERKAAAWAAGAAAWAAGDAAWAAGDAARAAQDAAWAARTAAWDAWDATWAAGAAAWAAGAAAERAALDAAGDAAGDALAAKLATYLDGTSEWVCEQKGER